MSWNKEKDILTMGGMASKGILYMKGNLEMGNIADNTNNCEEFAVTARGLRNHFANFMKGSSQKQDEKSKVATS